MGAASASVLVGLEASLLLPDSPPSVGDLLRSSLPSLAASAHAWTLAAALATYLVCLVSDLRVGTSRSAFRARCVVAWEPTGTHVFFLLKRRRRRQPEAVVCPPERGFSRVRRFHGRSFLAQADADLGYYSTGVQRNGFLCTACSDLFLSHHERDHSGRGRLAALLGKLTRHGPTARLVVGRYSSSRFLAREQAKRIATFASMPGWLTEPVCGFHGPGYEAGENLIL